jgi:erythronate-4-phosphate dehydrogenase
MRIVADKSIPFLTEAFSKLGTITLVEGRSISRTNIADAEVLLVRSITPVTRALIAGTKLRFIASATTGIEHIDVSYIKKNGIGFAYAPGSNANSVAQYVVAAILHEAGKNGRRLSDMTLGIIGAGNIGSLVHTYAEALGMTCIVNDPPKHRLSGNKLFRPLEEVLPNSDIVTLHVPLEKQGSDPTYHLVDSRFLKQMKPGAVLLNTSRGKVVNEAALKKTRPKLSGLVIDVWDNEPEIDLEICRMADIATPHIAGYSYDGKIRGTMMIHNAACSFFKNAPFWNPAELLSEQAGLIDATNASDPVFHAVKSAYPIMRDDAALRKNILLNVNKRALSTGFDALRDQYPKRPEFVHYMVRCTKFQGKAAEILTKLGFMVEIS